MLTFLMAYLAFLSFFGLTLVLKSRAVTNPFPDLSNLRFHSEDEDSILFRLSNFADMSKGDDIVTNLDLLVFPNFATTTNFHVHRMKQIFLTCELFLPERLPSGATMINRWWCYNY